jgi:hypothetical protein
MSTSHWSRISLLIGLFLTLSFLLTPAKEVQACMGDCQECWDRGCSNCSIRDGSVTCDNCEAAAQLATPPTIVNFVSSTHVRLTIEGYKTTNLQPTTSCITAFSPVEGVERVNSITNYNSETDRRFKEVAFAPAERPGYELAALAGHEGLPLGTGAPWFGFLSKITGNVNDNVSNHFVVDLTLKKGVRPDDFVQALRSQGMFATSSSTADGVPNPGHHHFRRLNSSEVLVLFPERPKPEKAPQ